jgi:predicted Fe-Mo cluster-binding NifX family protein
LFEIGRRKPMNNGRIAVPSVGKGGLEGQRSEHFGHCDTFTLVDVENGNIGNVTVVSNAEHSEGGCLVPVNLLASHKVNAIIVAGIGMRPLTGFQQAGIDVYHDSVNPAIKPVVEDLIAGKLQVISSNQTCQGGGGGGCQH